MKATAEKSPTTTPTPAKQPSGQPFFAKAGGGNFFEPAPTTTTAAPPVQLKLTVNKPGDKFEQEADRMADKVMRMPAPDAPADKLQRAPEEKLQKKDDDKLQKAPTPEEKIQRAELKDDKIQKKEEDKLMRKGDGTPAVAATTQSAIRQKTSGGQPLSADVRSYMEPRFGADFSQVRIHSDPEAASLSNHLSARAFTHQNHVFFSRGQYQPGTSEGKQLLAHELTHTIQQGHAVQRSAAPVSTTATPPPVQRLGVQDALDYFADKAYHIPGYRLLTIVIGFNPINMRSTDRSAANILRALVEVVPGGHLVSQALDNHGVFNKAGAWVEQKMAAFGDIGAEIVSGLKRFIDSLSWTDIFDLGGVWDRAVGIFSGPVGRLISFAGSVVLELLKMVKDAILKPLAALAQGTAGYDLLRVVLGEDPITGEPVPQTADALIGGFMKLIGQEEIYQNLKKGNALARAYAWFQGALAGLMGFVRSIPGRIVQTVSSLTFQDIITVAGAFSKIVGSFASIASDFFSWGFQQIIGLLEILFSVVAPGAVPYIKKAQGAFQSIIKNPVGFVGNLVAAGKLGFQLFAANIGEHLKNALIKWITGPLGEAGVYIPKSFTLTEILKLVLSVLGLTWQNIRGKLVKIIPEPVLAGLEKTAGILVTLVKDGPAAAWEQIKAELSELKDQLIAQVTQMVTSEIVKAAITKLVSMLNPAGAVIQAIIAIYNTITFFIQKISQIGAVVGAFIDSIAAIAAGQISGAAKKVEATMASTLTIVIGFLAKFAGLGNVPDKLVGIVKRIRQPIDKGLDKIVAWLGAMLKKAGNAISSAVKSFFAPKSFKVEGDDHSLYPDGAGEPMVASSNPQRLANALTELGGDVGLATELSRINKRLAAATDPTRQAEIQKEADKQTSKIVTVLVQLKYGRGTKDTMPLATVAFSISGNAVEFRRQIAMQEAELKSMKVGDWQRNRAKFVGFGRESRSIDTDAKRAQEFASKIIADVNAITGLSTGDRNSLLKYANSKGRITQQTGKDLALSIAERLIGRRSSSGKAVLHTVDQVAGGSATVYGDETGVLGSSAVNSSIGSQWKDKIADVDTKAKGVKATATVNVKLSA
ncbi:eCIS core domain-containing protein [Hymenobacter daeguensis]